MEILSACDEYLNAISAETTTALRDVQDHRPAPRRTTSAHAQQRYLPRPGDHPETPEPA